MPPHKTVTDLFLSRVVETPDRLAYEYVDGDGYAKLTWQQTAERVRALACGLLALGLEREQCCALVSGTRIEWILADLAVLCAGGATTTVYASSPVAECAYILSDAGCVFAFAENREQLEKLLSRKAELPALRKVVLFEGDAAGSDWVMSLAELEALGREYDRSHPGTFDERTRATDPGQLATIIYTSGTTGKPKGVRLTHDCWVYQAETSAELNMFTLDDHQLLWLPLSHAFGKVLEVCAIRIGFPTTIDGRVPLLMENLARVRPTFMGAPPRIFEKIYGKLMLAAEEGGAAKRLLVRWAFEVGGRVSRLRQAGEQPTGLLALKFELADRLVFRKLRARFGGRMRFLLSGSAPLPVELAEFFHAAGLLILEGYGLTETTGGAVLNRAGDFAFGSVGKPNRGTQVKLDQDGEILIKSRGVMQGYHNRPEETQAALTADGWLRTGDIGELDAAGNLRVTERKKDLIKTSAGLYVAPQRVEALLKAQCPYVGQVVVHGDRRSYCSALIALDPDAMSQWVRDAGLAEQPLAQLATRPDVLGLIQAAVDRVNSGLASHETIKRFALLAEQPSVENDLLTPSMKLRRKAAEQRYGSLLEGLYENVGQRSVQRES